jgi:hypothetical protein
LSTKIHFIIDNPEDTIAFEESVPLLLSLADKFPRLERLESARVWPKEDGSPAPAHRTLDFYFDNYDDAAAAIASPAATEFVESLDRTGTTFDAHFSGIEER